MRPVVIVLCVLLGSVGLHAETAAWQPSPGHTQVNIWRGTPPDAQPAAGPEIAVSVGPKGFVAGRAWVEVKNVTVPTITIYAPTIRNTGAAAVVFPGGGYVELAIDLEGTEVCDWLTSRGITAILLKYRVPHSGEYWDKQLGHEVEVKAPLALEDAQRAVGLVRFHAAEWGIDPHRIGVIGFSAGGHMVAAISTHFARRAYPSVDAADAVSCRPDFAVALYPGHLSLADNSVALNPDIRDHITARTPPTFLLQNEDDQVDRVEDSLSYYLALKRAGVPVEMHLYAQGGHGFGLRRTALPATAWPGLVEAWMRTIGMIGE